MANGCALIGGETAEMPGFYAPGELHTCGLIVGAVERKAPATGAKIRSGDVLIGLALPPGSAHQRLNAARPRKLLCRAWRPLTADQDARWHDAVNASYARTSTQDAVIEACHRSYPWEAPARSAG